jgi:hypothetical protein
VCVCVCVWCAQIVDQFGTHALGVVNTQSANFFGRVHNVVNNALCGFMLLMFLHGVYISILRYARSA